MIIDRTLAGNFPIWPICQAHSLRASDFNILNFLIFMYFTCYFFDVLQIKLKKYEKFKEITNKHNFFFLKKKEIIAKSMGNAWSEPFADLCFWFGSGNHKPKVDEMPPATIHAWRRRRRGRLIGLVSLNAIPSKKVNH